VGSEEEEEEEVWVEIEVILFAIIVPIQVIWQGIVKTRVLLETVVIRLNMSSNIVQYC
jgi:hypothetical protein